MKIIYTSHAEKKFDILKRYGIDYSKSQIEDILRNPIKLKIQEKIEK
jgi:hypothetical protein